MQSQPNKSEKFLIILYCVENLTLTLFYIQNTKLLKGSS